jgi:hypothetical protein
MAKHAWQVVDTVHDQVINTSANQTITGSYVYFLIADLGETASVFVPDSMYAQTDHVKNMIEQRVHQLVRVRDLKGEL